MDKFAQDENEAAASAVHKCLEDLVIHDLRVNILGDSVHLRGLVSGYEKKCLAAARAITALPGTYISNELRVGQV